MAMRRPAEVFPPGEILKEELEARGWTQADLAEIIGRHVNSVNEIVIGKRGISPEMARSLAAALGTSAEVWMNLDAAYQLSRVRDDDDDTIARRARLFAAAPVKEMIRRGWIEPSDSIAVLESRVAQFLGVDDIDDEPVPLPHAARKSTSYTEPETAAQRAWLSRAMQLSHAVHANRYSPKNVNEALSSLLLLRHAPQEVRHVPRVLGDAGIKLVIVEKLSGTRIDGACFWMDEAPVIALSLRFDRLDNFWFCLMHELGHVSQGAQSLDTDLLTVSDEDQRPKSEREADEFAVERLVPQRQLESFIARIGPLYTIRRITAFAHTMGVHPSIVIGQLQFRGEIAYSSFRSAMAPVREWITSSALTDGWGATVPLQK
jgi:HTH-type transcriptional regulator / antitoxin HigA